MSAMDELREAIDAHVGAASGDRKHTWMDAIRLLDAFEAAHPGLIDKTQLCENCGEPMPHYYGDGSGGPMLNPGWSYMMTQVGEKYNPSYFGEDEEIWLVCPACAKDAE